jgi:dTDP-glucose 4,6-dehydratase
MKSILITGGAGFIGSNFVNFLYKKYPAYKIFVLDVLTYAGDIANIPKIDKNQQIEFWYGNVTNADLVNSLVSRSNIVVHFAAESHVTRSIYDNKLFFETDVIGTQVVSNAILKNRKTVERFIHISTSEVYGTAVSSLMDEDHPLDPMSPYAAAKCGADRLVSSYWHTYEIPAIIVRPFNNYGPYQHLEKVIPRFISSAILGEPMRVHGDGMARRDFIHVDDHCDALDKILHAPLGKVAGQVFNLGTGKDVSILEIAKLIRSLVSNTQPPIQFIGNRPGQVFRHTCNPEKAISILDWYPKTSFEDGLKLVLKWYTDNQEWWEKQKWMRQIDITTADGKREMH